MVIIHSSLRNCVLKPNDDHTSSLQSSWKYVLKPNDHHPSPLLISSLDTPALLKTPSNDEWSALLATARVASPADDTSPARNTRHQTSSSSSNTPQRAHTPPSSTPNPASASRKRALQLTSPGARRSPRILEQHEQHRETGTPQPAVQPKKVFPLFLKKGDQAAVTATSSFDAVLHTYVDACYLCCRGGGK